MKVIRDLSLMAGFVSVGYGLYLAWPPLAWIVGGAIACSGALLSWYLEQKTKRRGDG